MALDQASRSPFGVSPPLAYIHPPVHALYVTRRRSFANHWWRLITFALAPAVYLYQIVVSRDHGNSGPLNHALSQHPGVKHTSDPPNLQPSLLILPIILSLCLNGNNNRPETPTARTMRQPTPRKREKQRCKRATRGMLVVLALASQLPATSAIVFPSHHANYKTDYLQLNKRYNPARRGPPEDWNGRIPLKITNSCPETVWPGITTQHGVGPGTGGFELASGESRDMWVGPTWQGRAWGRTNCTVNGESAGCTTGDCFGKLDCEFSVSLMFHIE